VLPLNAKRGAQNHDERNPKLMRASDAARPGLRIEVARLRHGRL
jgi:hypothetical protein